VDTRDGRVGCVVGRAGAALLLRAVVGGGEWRAGPEVVRVASEWEVRNADLWEENRPFWRTRLGERVPGVGEGPLWRSQPDRRPEAPPLTHRMRCDECGGHSTRSVEFGRVQGWQIEHAACNPAHRLFTETLTRPWRAHVVGEEER
jgi:hypothetical protein